MTRADAPATWRRSDLRTAAGRARTGAGPLRFLDVSWSLPWTGESGPRPAPADGVHVRAATPAEAAQPVRSAGLPVLVDAGPWPDDPADLARIVGDYEDAGVAGLWFTDRDDDRSADVEDAAARIEAAVSARRDENLLIGACPAARAGAGLIDAVHRARAQVAAGADMIVVEGLEVEAGYTVFRETLDVLLLADVTGSARSPLPTGQLADLGVDVVIYPSPSRGPHGAPPNAVSTGLRDTGNPVGAVPAGTGRSSAEETHR